jgi:hypothetical protein
MGSYPMGIGAAPPMAPDVSAQMGGGAPGLSAVADRQQAAAGPDAGQQANPHGALFAQANAIKTVLEQMSGDEPVFAPFARQAMSAIANGVSAVSAAPTSQSLPPDLAGAPPGIPGASPPLA